MEQELYGFKQWDELNDEARQELEEELMSQMAHELDLQFYRIVNDWIGDLEDAFNVPIEHAEDICSSLLGIWFEQNEHLGTVDTDVADLVEMRLNELEESSYEDLTEMIADRRKV